MMRSIQAIQAAQRPLAFHFSDNVRPFDFACNKAIEECLRTEAEWFCLIDNDTVPPENFLSALDEGEHAGYKIIGLPTPVYRGKGKKVWNSINFLHTRPLAPKMLAAWPGGGVRFIHRSVFEKIERPWFEYKINPLTREWEMSEDTMLSKKAVDAGIKVGVHGGFPCNHFHTVDLAKI